MPPAPPKFVSLISLRTRCRINFSLLCVNAVAAGYLTLCMDAASLIVHLLERMQHFLSDCHLMREYHASSLRESIIMLDILSLSIEWGINTLNLV